MKDFTPLRVLDSILRQGLLQLLVNLLAKPGDICREWMLHLDSEFNLLGFVQKHLEAPITFRDIEEILEEYTHEGQVYMIRALAAVIHGNGLLTDFKEDSEKISSPKPEDAKKKVKTKRKRKKKILGHPGQRTVPRKTIKKVVKETVTGKSGTGKEARAKTEEKITVPGMIRKMLGKDPTVGSVEELRNEAGNARLLAEKLNKRFGGKATHISISVYLHALKKKEEPSM